MAEKERNTMFLAIREALGGLGGELEGDRKAAKRVINRLVQILEERVDEPRMVAKVAYPLREVIVLAFFGILGGATTFSALEQFCRIKEKFFKKFLPLKSGVPSHDTFNRVFSLLDMDQFNDALVFFISSSFEDLRKVLKIQEPKIKQLCVDGKEARSSGRVDTVHGEIRNIQTLHVYSVFDSLCLKSVQIEQKSNEIPVAQRLLATMDLKNTLVSFDAMNTQKETVSVITAAKGYYLGGLKGNHKSLLSEAKLYFSDSYLQKAQTDPKLSYQRIEKAHNQVETSTFTIAKVKLTDDCEFSDWPNLKAIIRYAKHTIKVNSGKESEEVRYYITSLDNDAQMCAQAIRDHWQIENSLHGFLDIMFLDDENTTVNRRASGNFSILKKMALSLYKTLKPLEQAKTLSEIRRAFGWEYEGEVEKLLSLCDSRTLKKALQESSTKKER